MIEVERNFEGLIEGDDVRDNVLGVYFCKVQDELGEDTIKG